MVADTQELQEFKLAAGSSETSAERHSSLRVALTSILVFAIGLAVLVPGISNPPWTYYDEYSYVESAKAFLNDAPNPNPEAPPVGKLLIAVGIKFVGDKPLGWRIAGAICGALSLAAVFYWTFLLSGSYRIACVSAALTLFNNFLFVMSRVAMMDVFLIFFLLWGLVAYTAAIELELSAGKRRLLLILSGTSIGIAAACKWNAVDTWAVLLLASFALLRFSSRPFGRASSSVTRWAASLRQIGVPAVMLALVVMPVIAYGLTFWPLCRSLHLPFGMHQLLAMNLYIWRFHLAVPGNRFIASHWYSWPFNLGPQRALSYLLGNPVVMWGGLAALVFCFWRFWKRLDLAAGLIVLLYLANLLQWAVTPAKSTFYYYYFPAAMLLSVAMALAVHNLRRSIFSIRISLLVLMAAGIAFLWCIPRMAHLEAPWDCVLGCWS